jgi:maltose O-acetyltransferase
MKSNKERMLAGELYKDDPELTAERLACREALDRFNAISAPSDRIAVLNQILHSVGEGVLVEPPFMCDYGYNVTLGDNVFINSFVVLLDCNTITIGENCAIGPAVHIYAADHPRDPEQRRELWEFSRPVTIGANVWIGGSALIMPGVTIGDDSVIGAGSIVTKDIPARVVAAGNPCRVIRNV